MEKMIFVTSYVGSAKTRLITDQKLIKKAYWVLVSDFLYVFPLFFGGGKNPSLKATTVRFF